MISRFKKPSEFAEPELAETDAAVSPLKYKLVHSASVSLTRRGLIDPTFRRAIPRDSLPVDVREYVPPADLGWRPSVGFPTWIEFMTPPVAYIFAVSKGAENDADLKRRALLGACLMPDSGDLVAFVLEHVDIRKMYVEDLAAAACAAVSNADPRVSKAVITAIKAKITDTGFHDVATAAIACGNNAALQLMLEDEPLLNVDGYHGVLVNACITHDRRDCLITVLRTLGGKRASENAVQEAISNGSIDALAYLRAARPGLLTTPDSDFVASAAVFSGSMTVVNFVIAEGLTTIHDVVKADMSAGSGTFTWLLHDRMGLVPMNMFALELRTAPMPGSVEAICKLGYIRDVTNLIHGDIMSILTAANANPWCTAVFLTVLKYLRPYEAVKIINAMKWSRAVLCIRDACASDFRKRMDAHANIISALKVTVTEQPFQTSSLVARFFRRIAPLADDPLSVAIRLGCVDTVESLLTTESPPTITYDHINLVFECRNTDICRALCARLESFPEEHLISLITLPFQTAVDILVTSPPTLRAYYEFVDFDTLVRKLLLDHRVACAVMRKARDAGDERTLHVANALWTHAFIGYWFYE